MEELKTISPAPRRTAGAHDHGRTSSARRLRSDSRRAWMFKLGIAFNALAGMLIGIPILGYVLSGVFGKKNDSAWINLGPSAGFPENNTRLASYKNPFTTAWDGETATCTLLGPAYGGRQVPGVRHQLHAPRLSRPLVPGIAIVHVSLPRRGLL